MWQHPTVTWTFVHFKICSHNSRHFLQFYMTQLLCQHSILLRKPKVKEGMNTWILLVLIRWVLRRLEHINKRSTSTTWGMRITSNKTSSSARKIIFILAFQAVLWFATTFQTIVWMDWETAAQAKTNGKETDSLTQATRAALTKVACRFPCVVTNQAHLPWIHVIRRCDSASNQNVMAYRRWTPDTRRLLPLPPQPPQATQAKGRGMECWNSEGCD